MDYILYLLLVLSVGAIQRVESNTELRNLAYGKNVTQSSNHASFPKYAASYAVNGLLTDFSHTNNEKTPWLRIDLEQEHLIHEIEIFARADCCPGQLHDLDVRVGKTPSQMYLCGHFTGAVQTAGQRIAIWCPYLTVGRYVQLKIVMNNSNVLTPAEILVWGNSTCIDES